MHENNSFGFISSNEFAIAVLEVLADVVEVHDSQLALLNLLSRGLCCLAGRVKWRIIMVIVTNTALRGRLHFQVRTRQMLMLTRVTKVFNEEDVDEARVLMARAFV